MLPSRTVILPFMQLQKEKEDRLRAALDVRLRKGARVEEFE